MFCHVAACFWYMAADLNDDRNGLIIIKSFNLNLKDGLLDLIIQIRVFLKNIQQLFIESLKLLWFILIFYFYKYFS